MLFKIVTTFLIFLALTFFIYEWIKTLPVSIDTSEGAAEITVEIGKSTFWGKGRCHVCHRVGQRGYALRGPNLGEGKEGAMIAVRAQKRAAELDLATGTEYLVQSIAEPGAFVVPGYKNEMPEVFKAPIALTPSEIKSVVYYLESLGGAGNPDEIRLPTKLLAAYKRPAESFEFKIKGDVETGRELFFDSQGPAACSACHIATNEEGQPQGSTLGPDLTAIASFRTPRYILNKIVKPDSNVISGYEEWFVKTKDGRIFTGIIQEERGDELILQDKTNERFVIAKNEIVTRKSQTSSMMPSNYQKLLTKKQLYDLLAYLLTLDVSGTIDYSN
jgi:putative heme-binding domain-containing protein